MMGKISGLRRLNPESIIDVRQIFTWKLYYEFYIQHSTNPCLWYFVGSIVERSAVVTISSIWFGSCF